MDLLELDARLEKDIKHLEKSLVEYEKLMKEVSDLKYTFEDQTKELVAAYEKNLSDLDGKVNEKINKLEEENKRALMKIIKALTINEKEILHSKKEVAECIIDEVYMLQGKHKAIDESIEAINLDISKIKSESERSLINLSSELFKETMRAENKDRKLVKNFKIFMAISSVLFIVLLIWR